MRRSRLVVMGLNVLVLASLAFGPLPAWFRAGLIVLLSIGLIMLSVLHGQAATLDRMNERLEKQKH